MNTDCAKENVLKDNEEFVAFLHENARKEKIPATCDKLWLANVWRNNRGLFANLFVLYTGKAVLVPQIDSFFQQAAESYKG